MQLQRQGEDQPPSKSLHDDAPPLVHENLLKWGELMLGPQSEPSYPPLYMDHWVVEKRGQAIMTKETIELLPPLNAEPSASTQQLRAR